jgi:hypothetical protein
LGNAVSQQHHFTTAATDPETAPVPKAAVPKKPSPSALGFWGRFTIPLFAVLVALGFVALATLRWNEWTGNERIQVTDDAYVRAVAHPEDREKTSPPFTRSTVNASNSSSGGDEMEIAALRLISVLGCEPNIDVPARKATWQRWQQ